MKYVLVRTQRNVLYVLEKRYWDVYDQTSKSVKNTPQAQMVAESDDLEELQMFRALAEGDNE